MRFQEPTSNGPADVDPSSANGYGYSKPNMIHGPFKHHVSPQDITGPTYITAQTIVQQVAYALSDSLWTYSPETFGLDDLVKEWRKSMIENAYGEPTKVETMQVRQGAGSMVLGYIFASNLRKRCLPQSIIASSSSLLYLRAALDQLSNLHKVASPCAIHVAAVDYATASSRLVTDYTRAMTVAAETEFAMLASFSGHETQHMALFATILASLMPTMHIYDGVHLAGETTRLIDSLDFSGLSRVYRAVLQEITNPVLKKELDRKVVSALDAFNQELGTVYKPFEYHGHEEPEIVLVVFGSVEANLGSEIAVALSRSGAKVGLIAVRVYRPFIESEFLAALPKSTTTVGVLGQVHDAHAVSDNSAESALYADAVAAITFSDEKWTSLPTITDIKYPREQVWSQISMAAAFQLLSAKPLLKQTHDNEITQLLELSDVQQYTFYDLDDSLAADASIILGEALAKDSSHNITAKRHHDQLVQGGSFRTDIRRSKMTIDAPYSIDAADTVVVGHQSLLKHYDILIGLKSGGKVLLNFEGVKDDELEAKLPIGFKKAIAAKKAQVFILDPSAVENFAVEQDTATHVLQAAFLRVALPTLEKIGLEKLIQLGAPSAQKLDKLDQVLREVEVPEEWANFEIENDPARLSHDLSVNSFVGFDKTETEPPTYLRDWQTVAKGLSFKEAYATKTSLRPDVAVKTHKVTVKENRRLTPASYERKWVFSELPYSFAETLTLDVFTAFSISSSILAIQA